MIDTHCHLTEEKLMADLDGVLARAKENGVERIIVPGTSLEDSMKVVGLTEKYEEVYGLVGIHPEEIGEIFNFSRLCRGSTTSSGQFSIDQLKSLLDSEKIVGVGEIGMDFYWDKERKFEKEQTELFRNQLELAVEMNKPVVIHNREASKEITEIMNGMSILPRGQFHCWAGDKEMLTWALSKGFYISFCGNITFKSADNLREMIKKVPLDRLLLETDAPYLSPEPKRGTLNEPANVKILAGYIANLTGCSLETLINQTTKNAQCLFFGG